MIYLQLFLAFLQIGAFSFGGGYAAMPLIQNQVVTKYAWLSPSDFSDLVTISQMTPGPIAVNSATFVGNQVAGILGAIVATIGVILPSCIFVTLLAWLYVKYKNLKTLQEVLSALAPAVIAMIFTAGLTILIPTILPEGFKEIATGLNIRACILFISALIALQKFKLDPILVMVGCGVAELIVQFATSSL
ncbi:chromate transporter [Lachnospira multipara]|uniref:chromate transporter n=1 Tax=Lachnospira multipara TaxID=28051 RepID=UPI0004898DF7|nr:chromate transporter [Lachnospira multipara]